MRFQVGDKIRVIANGNVGTVQSIDQCFNSVYQELETYYNVSWDSFNNGKAYPYLATEVEAEWEVFSRVEVPVLPFTERKVEVDCNHSWKSYYGLQESFEYCEHCDKTRK